MTKKRLDWSDVAELFTDGRWLYPGWTTPSMTIRGTDYYWTNDNYWNP